MKIHDLMEMQEFNSLANEKDSSWIRASKPKDRYGPLELHNVLRQ